MTLSVPVISIAAFSANTDQDQITQNVKSDLESSLSAFLKHTGGDQQINCNYLGRISRFELPLAY